MEEQILVRGDKRGLAYYIMSISVILMFFIPIVLDKSFFNIQSMFEFLFVFLYSLLLIVLVIFIYKLIFSYINEEIYLTNTKFVLKRGKRTFEFPLESIIKLRCVNNGVLSIISIRTKDVKKYLVFNMENTTEIYYKYQEARKQLNLPPERDRENPIIFVFVMLILFGTIILSLFRDYLESIPAPDFVIQNVTEE